MERFFWLVDETLAGCSRPGGPERSHQHVGDMETTLDADLAWLKHQGIGAVLSLTETPLQRDVLDRHELDFLHLPVPDLQAPVPEQFSRALDFVDKQRAMGRAVVAHCLVGQGRTGTILAAYLIRAGASPEEAIARIRALCPGAIGSPVQESALRAYAGRRDWIL